MNCILKPKELKQRINGFVVVRSLTGTVQKSKYETDEMYSWRIPILNKYEDELEGKKSGKKKSKRKIITIVTSSESSDEESSIH